jgi:hypothetical protein
MPANNMNNKLGIRKQQVVKDMFALCKRFPKDVDEINFSDETMKNELKHSYDDACKKAELLRLVPNPPDERYTPIEKAHDSMGDWYQDQLGYIPSNASATFGSVNKRRSTRRRSTRRRRNRTRR